LALLLDGSRTVHSLDIRTKHILGFLELFSPPKPAPRLVVKYETVARFVHVVVKGAEFRGAANTKTSFNL